MGNLQHLRSWHWLLAGTRDFSGKLGLSLPVLYVSRIVKNYVLCLFRDMYYHLRKVDPGIRFILCFNVGWYCDCVVVCVHVF